MDKFIYWSMAGISIVSAWTQWYYGLSTLMSVVSWFVTFSICILLMRLSTRWVFCLVYISNTWMEFKKIHWSSLVETRSLAVSVSLMIAAFSVMLWLMDQLSIVVLTRWI